MSGFESLYGFLKDDTLDSLILNFLPPANFTCKKLEMVENQDESCTNSQEILRGLFEEVLNVLRNNLGFHIPQVRAYTVIIMSIHTCVHNQHYMTILLLLCSIALVI